MATNVDGSSSGTPNLDITSEPSYTYNVTLTTDHGTTCEIDPKYNISTSVVAVFCFIFGILYTFFGKY